jgi:hypothetical protein
MFFFFILRVKYAGHDEFKQLEDLLQLSRLVPWGPVIGKERRFLPGVSLLRRIDYDDETTCSCHAARVIHARVPWSHGAIQGTCDHTVHVTGPLALCHSTGVISPEEREAAGRSRLVAV